MGKIPIIKMENICKEFPGVKALNDVNLEIYPGEVHVLIGENGAGKSTLIKILSGVYHSDKGCVYINGDKIYFKTPKEAIDNGVAVIPQEISVVPDLTVFENILLGREIKKHGIIDRKACYLEAKKYIDQLGVNIDPNKMVRDLSNAEKQMLEIIRSISLNASLIIMDEPTSSLSDPEVVALLRIVEELKKKDVAIIYISHRLNELFAIGDKVTVLRDGNLVSTSNICDINEDKLVSLMVGREIKNYFNRTEKIIGEEILKVENLTRADEFSNISLNVKQGEIVGIAGLAGAGRSEVLKCIFGATKASEGSIEYKNKKVCFSSPQHAIKAGIGLVPEDRRTEGVIIDDDVKSNVSLPNLKNNLKNKLIDKKWERDVAEQYVKKLLIKTPSIDTPTKNLSGGNQQKVVIAKWLVANAELLLLDELTRGIDVNAKSEIYSLINEFSKSGGAALMVSSELPELLGVCDRIIVMREGQIAGSFDVNDSLTEEDIMKLASIH